MIAVVIVNWNGRRFLDACLASVYGQTLVPGLVVVVDNASTDDSVAHLRRNWPAVSVVEAPTNLGFAGGNNLGIETALAAGADAVLLLNNDAELFPDALGQLHHALESRGTAAWAAVPKILYRHEPTLIWSAGGEIDWWRGLAFDRGFRTTDQGQFETTQDVEFANGCCILILAEAFRIVGLLDESYFMYFEDADFSVRLARAGGRIVYQPAARVFHVVQGSSGGGDRVSSTALYYWTRNRVHFIARYAPNPVWRLAAHAFTLGSRLVRIGQAVLAGRREEAVVVLRALRAAYLRRETGRVGERPKVARV